MRQRGATPATVAVLAGRLHVGLDRCHTVLPNIVENLHTDRSDDLALPQGPAEGAGGAEDPGG